MSSNSQDHSEEIERIPLVEEKANVDIEDKLSATVRVTTRTEQTQEWVRAELQRSDVQVKTVTIGREVSSPPEIRVEGDTTIVPLLEEIIVVEKRLFLREELHITKRSVIETVEQPISLRKQHVSVERIEDTKEKQE